MEWQLYTSLSDPLETWIIEIENGYTYTAGLEYWGRWALSDHFGGTLFEGDSFEECKRFFDTLTNRKYT